MLILGSGSLAGQEEVIAFGDSITQGASWQDEENKGGYPGPIDLEYT